MKQGAAGSTSLALGFPAFQGGAPKTGEEAEKCNTFDATRVETLLFDSYSTIVSVESVVGTLDKYVEDAEDIADLWRTRSLEYSLVSNYIDEYQPFFDLIGSALQHALDAYDAEVSNKEFDDILNTYHDLEPFDDVREGMKRLSNAGYDLYVLSNGNPEMLRSLVTVADIDPFLEDTISADEIRTYKPDEDLYQYAAERTETELHNLAHVTAPWFDVQGAMHAGIQGVWVNREKEPWTYYNGTPDVTIGSFLDLADILAAEG